MSLFQKRREEIYGFCFFFLSNVGEEGRGEAGSSGQR